MNDEIMVADSKNRRIQSFTRRKIFKDSFFTNDEPYSLVVDIYYNVVVGTYKRTVEIYRRGGRLVNRFRVCPKNTQVSLRWRLYFVKCSVYMNIGVGVDRFPHQE